MLLSDHPKTLLFITLLLFDYPKTKGVAEFELTPLVVFIERTHCFIDGGVLAFASPFDVSDIDLSLKVLFWET